MGFVVRGGIFSDLPVGNILRLIQTLVTFKTPVPNIPKRWQGAERKVTESSRFQPYRAGPSAVPYGVRRVQNSELQ